MTRRIVVSRMAGATLAVVAFPSFATAATILVPADHATIQAAVDAAVPGDVIVVSKGSYAESVVIDGKTNLTLSGRGKVAVDGGGTGRPLSVVNSTTVVIERVAFVRSIDDGLHVEDSTGVTVRSCRVFSAPNDGFHFERSPNALIEGNRIERCGEDGIEMDDETLLVSSASTARGNVIRGVGDEGFDVTGSGHRIEGNKVSNAQDDGILVEGDDNVVVGNKVTGTGDGIYLSGDRNEAQGNKVTRAGDDGLDIEGDDNRIIGNTVKKSDFNGIDIEPESAGDSATGNLVEGNAVSRCAVDGIRLATGGNTVRSNTAKRNRGFDLHDEAGSNVYESNTFGTQSVP